MKRLLMFMTAFLMLSIANPTALLAKGNKAESAYQAKKKRVADGAPKMVRVKGYTKKNGTYVAPHSRRSPKHH